jgi:hypothetical protein
VSQRVEAVLAGKRSPLESRLPYGFVERPAPPQPAARRGEHRLLRPHAEQLDVPRERRDDELGERQDPAAGGRLEFRVISGGPPGTTRHRCSTGSSWASSRRCGSGSPSTSPWHAGADAECEDGVVARRRMLQQGPNSIGGGGLQPLVRHTGQLDF